MKKMIVSVIALYVGVFIIFSCVFLLLFHTALFASQHVLVYRGVGLLGVTAFIISLLAVCFGRPLAMYWQTIVAAIIISIAMHMSMFVVFPVTFERSVTMFTLESLQSAKTNVCGGLSKKSMEEKLIQDYVIGRDAMAKRIEEQSIIHMIEKNNDCYTVTDQATRFLQFSHIVKSIYNIK